jgi:hypothetical protein
LTYAIHAYNERLQYACPERVVNDEKAKKAKTMKDRDKHSTTSTHVYEIRPRTDKDGVDLISDALFYSPLWYREPNAIRDAVAYAKFYSGSHDAVIRVYDETGNLIETQEHAGGVQGW